MGDARLTLRFADGTSVVGRSFGAPGHVRGEVVFNTGMAGYVEALTDPSYRGQILVLTYPLQGNYGVPPGPWESGRIQVQGLIVHQYYESLNHHRAMRSLGQWLKDEGVPAITGVDTRKLTLYLRSFGTAPGVLSDREGAFQSLWSSASGVDMAGVAALVSGGEIRRVGEGSPTLLVIDTGSKDRIIQSLTDRGAGVIVAPFQADWEAFLKDVDGVVLTNGPGDPSDLGPLVKRLRVLLERRIPTFGICLGHQLLALAAGARTYKLPFGHRSLNQPVQDVRSKACFVTSQNHGYAVDGESLPDGWEPWFINLNDGTNEGIRHTSAPFSSVQFHPEAAGGPRDTAPLFDQFLECVRGGMNHD